MLKYLPLILLTIATHTALAQTPIPRVGDSCPTGTYTSGDYCKPFASTIKKGDVIIQLSGDNCPRGFYKTGSYCKAYGGSDKEVITREEDARCPPGWYRSGGYCVRH